MHQLIGPWNRARERFGDDIAQRAILQTLKKPREDSVSYFVSHANRLSRLWFNDGQIPDNRKSRRERLRRFDADQVPGGTRMDGDSIRSEVARESRTEGFEDALLEYLDTQRAPFGRCPEGHGPMIQVTRKNGSAFRRCRACAAAATRAHYWRKRNKDKH